MSVRRKRQRIRGALSVANVKAYRPTVHAINIISQRQHFVAHCISSCVGKYLVYFAFAFVSFPPAG
jgi:hypothetical protein